MFTPSGTQYLAHNGNHIANLRGNGTINMDGNTSGNHMTPKHQVLRGLSQRNGNPADGKPLTQTAAEKVRRARGRLHRTGSQVIAIAGAQAEFVHHA